jgi:hypothetical protein
MCLSPYRECTDHVLGLAEQVPRAVSCSRCDIRPLHITMADPTTSEFVTLVSCDGFEFIIPRSAACISGTIRRMLDPASTLIYDDGVLKPLKVSG